MRRRSTRMGQNQSSQSAGGRKRNNLIVKENLDFDKIEGSPRSSASSSTSSFDEVNLEMSERNQNFENADDGELFEENETSRLIAKNDIISQDSENVKKFNSDLYEVDSSNPDSDSHQESARSVFFEILFPFIIAGLGMVAAGFVLDVVQHWPVFERVTELFILVPALLGLKGNLEMTLASRLSTAANCGKMDTREDALSLITSNLALVQCQAIVVALVASLFAVIVGYIPEGKFDTNHALLLCAASIVTASIASFILGLVMVFVIAASRRCGVNPDNVATPIAASLGDLTTLTLLAWISSVLYADIEKAGDKVLAPTLICSYVLLVAPACVFIAHRNTSARVVLKTGWTPVLLAMIISSLGGVILNRAVAEFDGIAVFQPVMNGVGGNLAAVQASRISTYLHLRSTPGILPLKDSAICVNPWNVFCGESIHSRTAVILISLVVPGHILFSLAITLLEAGHTSLTLEFMFLYLLAALIQVWILLHAAWWMIHLMWKNGVDPDNSAIPYLTAMGDLLGGGLLWLAFEILFLSGDKGMHAATSVH